MPWRTLRERAAINSLLAGWRSEAADVEAQLAAITHTVRLAPAAKAAIDSCSALLDKIEMADHDRLRQALSATIKTIYFGRRRSSDGCYGVTYGWIELQPGLGSGKIEFDVKDGYSVPIGRRLPSTCQGFPPDREVARDRRGNENDQQQARAYLKRAVKKCVAIRNPNGQGWLAKL